jgi:hypothetical protein
VATSGDGDGDGDGGGGGSGGAVAVAVAVAAVRALERSRRIDAHQLYSVPHSGV